MEDYPISPPTSSASQNVLSMSLAFLLFACVKDRIGGVLSAVVLVAFVASVRFRIEQRVGQHPARSPSVLDYEKPGHDAD